jgi:hypothetical protein
MISHEIPWKIHEIPLNPIKSHGKSHGKSIKSD